jgi:hypothetical protein
MVVGSQGAARRRARQSSGSGPEQSAGTLARAFSARELNDLLAAMRHYLNAAAPVRSIRHGAAVTGRYPLISLAIFGLPLPSRCLAQ